MRISNLASCLFCLFCIIIASRAQAITQRRINEMAATLQRAQKALIEETRLRKNNEYLDKYFARIALQLPGEKLDRYDSRIEGYLHSLSDAEKTTRELHAQPTLHDKSDGNRKLWEVVSVSLSSLPVKMEKLKLSWKQTKSVASGKGSSLGAELTQTLRFIKTAYDALRNARP